MNCFVFKKSMGQKRANLELKCDKLAIFHSDNSLKITSFHIWRPKCICKVSFAYETKGAEICKFCELYGCVKLD